MEKFKSDVVLWAVTIFLAVAYFLVGVPKLVGVDAWLEKFTGWGYSPWFVRLIGALEVLGASFLLLPRLALAGAVILATVMFGASYTHLASGDDWELLRPLVFLLLLGIVAWLRFPHRAAVETGPGAAEPAAAERGEVQAAR